MPRTALALLLLGSLVVACGEDDPSTPGGGPGDTTTPGDTTNPGDTTQPGSCTAPEPTALGAFPVTSIGFAVTNDGIYTYDPKSGNDTGNVGRPKTGAILKLPKTGGEPTVFYAPSNVEHGLGEILGIGDDLFFLENDLYADDEESAELYRLPQGGGAPVLVTTTKFDPFGLLRTHDDTNVYYATSTVKGSGVYRIPRAGGAAVLIGDVDGTLVAHTQVHGGNVYFVEGQGTGAIWRTPVNAASAAEQVLVKEENPCLTGLRVVDDGYLCTGALSLTKLGTDFAQQAKLYDVLETAEDADGSAPTVHGIDGQDVFFNSASPASKRVSFRTFALGETTTRAIACGVANVRSAHVGADGIWLLEQSENAAGEQVYQVKKIAR